MVPAGCHFFTSWNLSCVGWTDAENNDLFLSILRVLQATELKIRLSWECHWRKYLQSKRLICLRSSQIHRKLSELFKLDTIWINPGKCNPLKIQLWPFPGKCNVRKWYKSLLRCNILKKRCITALVQKHLICCRWLTLSLILQVPQGYSR